MTTFTKLRGVHEDQLGAALTALTDEEWDQLESGYLDVISLDVSEVLDLLGLDEDRADSVSVFWRIYQHMLNRTPEIVS